MDFDIDLPDLPGFVTALRAAPQMLNAELTTATKKISDEGKRLSTDYAPLGPTGILRGSMYSRPRSGGGSYSAIWGADADYAIFVEKGRGPNKPMPPKGALLGWGGVTEENEFPIRRKIGRDGIPPRPFVGKAFNEIKGAFAHKAWSDAIARVLAKIGRG
jgi:hypothetical protein